MLSHERDPQGPFLGFSLQEFRQQLIEVFVQSGYVKDASRFEEHDLHEIHTCSVTDTRDRQVALSIARRPYGHVVKVL